VTPTSQIVGTQAVLNVLVNGERYRNVTKEVKDYIHGQYGKSPAPVSTEIRTLIIGSDEVITVRPADLLEPAYEKMKAEATKAGLIHKEEDVLTYILYPAIAPSFLKGERTLEEIPRIQPAVQPVSGMPGQMEVEVDGEVFSIRIISVGGNAMEVASVTPQKTPRGEMTGGIKSNMQGMVLKVNVSRGAVVKKGDTLIVLEAMKMENPIHSPVDGKVIEIFVDTGDVVKNGDVLLVVQ
jgi:pyruvate carboxylase subunit B